MYGENQEVTSVDSFDDFMDVAANNSPTTVNTVSYTHDMVMRIILLEDI